MTEEQRIKDLLTQVRTIALVGASHKPERASYRVMAFLQQCGYRVYPVNPALAGKELHGERVLADLSELPESVDMVDIFRNSEAAGAIVDQAIAIGAGAVWMQLGVINEAARQRAEQAGLTVVMDRCPKIEIPTLGIETPGAVSTP